MSASGGSSGPLPSGTALIDRAEGRSLEVILASGIGGFILGFINGGIELLNSIYLVAILPITQFGVSIADLVTAFFGEGMAGILDAAAQATQSSIGPGGTFNIGPLTFPIFGVGVVLLSLFIIGRYRDEEETGNLVPGLPADIPFVGEDEEGSE